MFSSDITKSQSPLNVSTHGLSDIITSTSIDPLVTTNEASVIMRALPSSLAAPTGWHTELVHSTSSISTDTELDLTNTNNYEEYNTSNIVNTSVNNYDEYNTQFNQTSSTNLSNTNEYLNKSIDENLFHRRQSILTEQQQQNIINTIENQQPPPVIVHKKLPNNVVTYQQNVSVRYLQPPQLPPPGPLIIREVRPPQPPPRSPIQIRQRPPPPPSPPPLVLRERPPPIPPKTPAKVVEKVLPPAPPGPRRVIVERYGACPPKPRDVIVERWLPYKQTDQRRILLERAPPPPIPAREPNLLILHDSPHARVHKHFINQGVVRADPNDYLQRYGTELNTFDAGLQHGYLVEEATRAVPPPPLYGHSDHHDYHSSYLNSYSRAPSPIISNTWERTRVVSPIPRSSSFAYDYSHYDSPYNYCSQPSYRYGFDSYRSYDDYPIYRGSYHSYDDYPIYRGRYPYYDDYPTYRGRYHSYDDYPIYRGRYHSYDDYPIHRGSYLTMTDVTPSWNHYCRSSSYYPYSSYYPSRTIRVGSENEFQHVLSDLTNGRIPSTLY